MSLRSPLINVMIGAARKAARGLVRDFGEVEHLQVSMKGTSDFVSSADLKAEKVLRGELRKARPDFGFLLEEGGEIDPDKSQRWIIDPLDGTTNFIHGIPHFAISIAAEREGEVIAGVIYQPLTDEMFTTEKGAGVFVNERRLRVSARRKLEDAVVATGIPHRGRGDHPAFLTQLQSVMAATAGVRRFGAASLDLAFVAAGRYDAYWETGLKPWDVAAGALMVKEGGGYVSEVAGGHNYVANGDILAANDHLHLPLGSLLRSAANQA